MFQKDGEFDYETYKDFLDNYLGYSEADVREAWSDRAS